MNMNSKMPITFEKMNYKNTYLITWIMLFVAFNAFSQTREDQTRSIESAKIALITERLQLTPAQAEKFWPVYNEFSTKKRDLLRQQHRERKASPDAISESEAKAILEERATLKKQELALDEKYIPLLIEITSAKQVLSLQAAEREFRRLLLKRIRHKK